MGGALAATRRARAVAADVRDRRHAASYRSSTIPTVVRLLFCDVTNLTIRGALAALLIAPLALTACSGSSEPQERSSRCESTSPTPTTTSPSPPPTAASAVAAVRPDGQEGRPGLCGEGRQHAQRAPAAWGSPRPTWSTSSRSRAASPGWPRSSPATTRSSSVRSAARASPTSTCCGSTAPVGLFYSGSQTPLLPKLQARRPQAGVLRRQTARGYTRAAEPADALRRDRRLRRPCASGPARSRRRRRSATRSATRPRPAASPPRTSRSPSRSPGSDAQLVGEPEALPAVDGRRQGHGGRGRPARRDDVRRAVLQAVTPSVYHDVNGANTPLTKTVGHGKALFFRDGQEYEGKWSRSKASEPTKYTFADGSPAVFAPGQIWIALLPKGRPVTAN